MTHFGIICPSASGHLNPMMALGYELKQRGHRLTVFGIEDVRSKVVAAGLEFQTIGKSEFSLGATKDYDPSWLGLLRNRLIYPLLAQITKPITKVILSYRQQWNLSLKLERDQDGFSQLTQISQQPASFEFPRQKLPAQLHFTSSFNNPLSRESVPFPYEKLTGQPLIYASLGTVQNRLTWVFQAIAEACADLDVQLVIALGGGNSSESLPELPGNTIVVSYAPQLELLPRAALTITHAGMNITLESLCNGVPMVAIPITNDQPGVAARIAWTQTGEFIPLKKVSVAKLQTTIKKVLTEEVYRQNAAKLQGAMERGGGVSKAADIIEQAIATKKPVLARSP